MRTALNELMVVFLAKNEEVAFCRKWRCRLANWETNEKKMLEVSRGKKLASGVPSAKCLKSGQLPRPDETTLKKWSCLIADRPPNLRPVPVTQSCTVARTLGRVRPVDWYFPFARGPRIEARGNAPNLSVDILLL